MYFLKTFTSRDVTFVKRSEPIEKHHVNDSSQRIDGECTQISGYVAVLILCMQRWGYLGIPMHVNNGTYVLNKHFSQIIFKNLGNTFYQIENIEKIVYDNEYNNTNL